ncbi:MAG TPA: zinc ABC transporter substrate-binding protein [Thermoanaerobaculia bacterium]|nr:zinc ABC transporter substrate-binding protein [Thermoanaerobaculia bacterium]
MAASVPPLAYLVDRLGGERVATTVLVPPGTEPHAYEPSPRQIAALADAHLFVEIGHPAFPFEARFLDHLAATNPGLQVVEVAAAVELLEAGDDEHDHGEAMTDPHVWLAPGTMARAAREVAAALVQLDPEHARDVRARLDAFLADIAALDRRLAAVAAGAKRRSFLVHHAAWTYLAAEYGLDQVAVEAGGREPGPRQLARIAETARREGIRVVFVQQGFSPQSAQVLADELGGRVVALDPMAYDWLATMHRVADGLEEALR